jgi:hypothetical protein
MMRTALLLLAALALGSCRMGEDDRRTLLESSGRTSYEVARGTVVRDMRSPSDTGRLIYQQPVFLGQRTAHAAGAEQVWAPFGIATPDTVPPAQRR